jgi:hypothetical protein
LFRRDRGQIFCQPFCVCRLSYHTDLFLPNFDPS